MPIVSTKRVMARPTVTKFTNTDYYGSANNVTPNGNTDMMFSMGLKLDFILPLLATQTATFWYLAAYESAAGGWGARLDVNGALVFELVDGGGVFRTTTAYTVQHSDQGRILIFTARKRASDNTLQLFIDGVSTGAGVACTGFSAPAAGNNFRLGRGSAAFTGAVQGAHVLFATMTTGAARILSDAQILSWYQTVASQIEQGQQVSPMVSPLLVNSDVFFDAPDVVQAPGVKSSWVDRAGTYNLTRNGNPEAGQALSHF